MAKRKSKNDKNLLILLAIMAGVMLMAKNVFSVTIKTSPAPSDSGASGAFEGGGAGGGGGGTW